MKNTYIWYSPATDVTGKIIAEKLGCESGTKKPLVKFKKVVCWGTKTKDAVNVVNNKVFNHPDNIRVNRNKLLALKKMKAANCKIAAFSENFNDLNFPMIARTKYHQGGSGFWLCLNKSQVSAAANEGAQYYQNYINIKDEYRLHVVDGKVIYAVKKVARNNLKDAFVNHYGNHINNYAKKNNINVDTETLELTLRRLARKLATSVDMIVRSNTRGWKFNRVKPESLDASLKKQAIDAVAALGLTYGAVDCCTTNDSTYIIECNTGPGLEGSSLEAWIIALKELLNDKKEKPAANKVVVEAQAVPAKMAKKNVKEKLKAQAKMMEAMVDAADNAQLEALQGLWQKMGVV